jgi:hypothetical protein
MGSSQGKLVEKKNHFETKKDNLNIPEELKMQIFTFLDVQSLCEISMVSKEFYKNSQDVFQIILLERYRIYSEKDSKNIFISLYKFKGTFSGIGTLNKNKFKENFEILMKFNRFHGKYFKGDLNWTIGNQKGTNLIQGELYRNHSKLNFKNAHSFEDDDDQGPFFSGDCFEVNLVKNILMIGSWGGQKNVHLSGAFILILDEFKSKFKSFPIELNTKWKGMKTNQHFKFKDSILQILGLENGLQINVTDEREEKNFKFKKESSKYVSTEDEHSFLIPFGDLIIISIFEKETELFSLGYFFLSK